MAKETPAFLGGKIGNNATDPSQQAPDRLLGCFAQVRLELAEDQFSDSAGQAARRAAKKDR
jgi:hypothetical protein